MVAGAGTWLGNESAGIQAQGLVSEGCMTLRVSASLKSGVSREQKVRGPSSGPIGGHPALVRT